MSLYGPIPGLSLQETIHAIFLHYCSPLKSSLGMSHTVGNYSTTSQEETYNTLDGVSFFKMCKDTPGLTKLIGRVEIDLAFTKAKPSNGTRRLSFNNFLDALVELSIKVYPDDEPTTALATFLCRYLFGLLNLAPVPLSISSGTGQSTDVISTIYDELASM